MLTSLSLPDPGRHSIQAWSGLHTELVWIYDGVIHPSNRVRQADHRVGYWVWLVHRGTAETVLDGRFLRARAGECLVSPRGVLEQRFSRDAKILSIHFRCNWPSGDELFAEKKGVVLAMKKFPTLRSKAMTLARKVRRVIPPASDIHFGEQIVDYASFLSLQRAFSEWLQVFADTLLEQGFTYSPVIASDARLHHIVQCLNESSLSQPFPARLVEQESGLGRSQLDRLFVQSFGMTTRSFWAKRRLQAARAILSTSSDSIKQVSFRLGFKQVSHFSSWFQLQVGCSPIEFRRRERLSKPAEGDR